jgi:uncharacterized BrkB/YihY/UPF0761 family membrane protein
LLSLSKQIRFGIFVATCISTPILLLILITIAVTLDYFSQVGLNIFTSGKELSIPFGFVFLAALVGAIPAALSALIQELWFRQSQRMWWRDVAIGGLIGGLVCVILANIVALLFFGFTQEHATSVRPASPTLWFKEPGVQWLLALAGGFYFGGCGTFIRLYWAQKQKIAAL